MRKKGFTIAETLVVLAIVGAISLVTMPTFISNQNKQVYTKTLQVAISNFNTAMTNMMIQDGVDSLLETNAWKGFTSTKRLNNTSSTKDEDLNNFNYELGKVLSIYGYSREVRTYSNLAQNGEVDLYYPVRFVAKNGVEYFLESLLRNNGFSDEEALEKNITLTDVVARVYIDVNGQSAPNILGRDLFLYVLGTNGILYPCGGEDYNVRIGPVSLSDCPSKVDGSVCSGYLNSNGYKMDY